ncbi:MAG: tetratricopeptide repeat protein [Candidatus Polarisedimenticolia bacterium]
MNRSELKRAAGALGPVGLVAAMLATACASLDPAGPLRTVRIQAEQARQQQAEIGRELGDVAGGASTYFLRRGYTLHHQGAHAEAERTLAQALHSGAPRDVAAEAIYWIAECRLARGLAGEAITAFREAAARDPEAPIAGRALYRAALAQRLQGDDAGARCTIEELLRRQPESDAAALARDHLLAAPVE